MRFRFGMRWVLFVVFVFALVLATNNYMKNLRRTNWRQLSEKEFESSLKANRLVLLEFSEIAFRVRWDQNNDFMESNDCWQYLNWNDIHAYRVESDLYQDEKKWLLDWMDNKIADLECLTAVVIYDPLRNEIMEFENRDPDTIIETIRQVRIARSPGTPD